MEKINPRWVPRGQGWETTPTPILYAPTPQNALTLNYIFGLLKSYYIFLIVRNRDFGEKIPSNNFLLRYPKIAIFYYGCKENGP